MEWINTRGLESLSDATNALSLDFPGFNVFIAAFADKNLGVGFVNPLASLMKRLSQS